MTGPLSGERAEHIVTETGLAHVLKDAAWQGRWNPLSESNYGPLAEVTAEVIVKEYARRGLRLVIEEAPQTTPTGDET